MRFVGITFLILGLVSTLGCLGPSGPSDSVESEYRSICGVSGFKTE